MKFQIALDFFALDKALELMEIIHSQVDIVEIGSPLIYAEGFRAVTIMKKKYPELLVLADLKIVDGGFEIADAAFKAGADIVTTIGMTNNETLKGVIRAARQNHREALADMIGAADLKGRAMQLEEMGMDRILLHTAHDQRYQLEAPVRQLKDIKAVVKRAKVGISGGINVELFPEVCQAHPDFAVVGSCITLAEDPWKVTEEFMNCIRD